MIRVVHAQRVLEAPIVEDDVEELMRGLMGDMVLDDPAAPPDVTEPLDGDEAKGGGGGGDDDDL